MTNNSLTFASGNAHKCAEIQEMLGIPLRSLRDVESPPELIEDGDSFEANALIKARGLAVHLNGWALADDSGLAVDVLEGAPGIYSARFAGVHGDDAANNRLLLEKLRGETNRRAKFVCVLALCGPEGEEWVVRGECHGDIALEAAGENGFGYDPLFHPCGYEKSFAELGEEIKNRISHRAEAIKAILRLPDQPVKKFLTPDGK
ncbi:MAG: RdgB/HAM1 family non-canonical purine NTP pyrophosphatase [Kiritimatiellia bacterium]